MLWFKKKAPLEQVIEEQKQKIIKELEELNANAKDINQCLSIDGNFITFDFQNSNTISIKMTEIISIEFRELNPYLIFNDGAYSKVFENDLAIIGKCGYDIKIFYRSYSVEIKINNKTLSFRLDLNKKELLAFKEKLLTSLNQYLSQRDYANGKAGFLE